jgi:hypothetical protein
MLMPYPLLNVIMGGADVSSGNVMARTLRLGSFLDDKLDLANRLSDLSPDFLVPIVGLRGEENYCVYDPLSGEYMGRFPSR